LNIAPELQKHILVFFDIITRANSSPAVSGMRSEEAKIIRK
jgi:hypothetical protein